MWLAFSPMRLNGFELGVNGQRADVTDTKAQLALIACPHLRPWLSPRMQSSKQRM
jgi:hypothetical protein